MRRLMQKKVVDKEESKNKKTINLLLYPMVRRIGALLIRLAPQPTFSAGEGK